MCVRAFSCRLQYRCSSVCVWGGGVLDVVGRLLAYTLSSLFQVLAGMIGSSFGWRSPYLFIASLGMAAVYLVHLKGEEPVRGACVCLPCMCAPFACAPSPCPRLWYAPMSFGGEILFAFSRCETNLAPCCSYATSTRCGPFALPYSRRQSYVPSLRCPLRGCRHE